MAMCLSSLVSYSIIRNVAAVILNRTGSMVSDMRNGLVDQAAAIGADWILWIDSDMSFPADALMRLLSRSKDLIGAVYNKRVPPYEPLGAFEGPDRDLSKGGLVPAKYMPGGFMLISTRVYSRLRYPWYFETNRAAGDPIQSFTEHLRDCFALEPPKAVLDLLLTSEPFNDWLFAEADAYKEQFPGLRTMSEDYNFCRKARRYGYKIWCDLDLSFKMGHIGETTVTTNPPPAVAPIENPVEAPVG